MTWKTTFLNSRKLFVSSLAHGPTDVGLPSVFRNACLISHACNLFSSWNSVYLYFTLDDTCYHFKEPLTTLRRASVLVWLSLLWLSEYGTPDCESKEQICYLSFLELRSLRARDWRVGLLSSLWMSVFSFCLHSAYVQILPSSGDWSCWTRVRCNALVCLFVFYVPLNVLSNYLWN